MTTTEPKLGDLQVWWIPQIPGKQFRVPVKNLNEAILLLDTLADYDLFQFENNIKPDYCNAGGLVRWENVDREGNFDWCDYCDDETGDTIDDIMQQLIELREDK